jgi:D-mannonate dehydratase
MPKSLDIKELIKRNPKVSAKQLRAVIMVLRELKKSGIQGAQYNLAVPFSRMPHPR